MNATDGCLLRIVKLRVVVTALLQLPHAFRSTCAEIIQSAKDNRFGGTNLCTGRYESAFLSIVTESALECAACIGKRLGPAIDHTKRAGNDAVAATVAHVILHENRTDLGAHDRAGWARFEAAGLFAMFADVGEKDPAEWILAIATA